MHVKNNDKWNFLQSFFSIPDYQYTVITKVKTGD